MRAAEAERLLRAMSDQVDTHNRARGIDGPHLLRVRIGKLYEEAGEVEEALIAFEGSNPRKAQRSAAIIEVETELLDVMVAAAGAWLHLYPEGSILDAFADHIRARARRAGVA